MVLTNEDLLAVSGLLDGKLQPIQTGIEDVKNRISALEARVSSLEVRMSSLENRVSSLEDRMSNLESEVADLKSDMTQLQDNVIELGRKVTITNLEIENSIRPHIQLLAENYVPAAKRYERASSYMEEMRSDIDVMKKVITEHSETLQRLA